MPLNPIMSKQPNSPLIQGFSMVEVMMTIVIASFGLLGLASLLIRGIQNNNSSFSRNIAVQQAYDLADRMRTNSTALSAGGFDSVTFTSGQTCTPCPTAGCTPTQLATYDICAWNVQNASVLPSGQGTVTKSGNIFQITVSWNDKVNWGDSQSSNTTKSFSLKVQP